MSKDLDIFNEEQQKIIKNAIEAVYFVYKNGGIQNHLTGNIIYYNDNQFKVEHFKDSLNLFYKTAIHLNNVQKGLRLNFCYDSILSLARFSLGHISRDGSITKTKGIFKANIDRNSTSALIGEFE